MKQHLTKRGIKYTLIHMFKRFFKTSEKVDPSDKDLKYAYNRMVEQINAKGGSLSFDIKTDDEGWFAVCKEFPEIMTGGSNNNPAQEEIFLSAIDAVKTAFNVPITKLSKPEMEIRSMLNLERTPIKFSWQKSLLEA